MEYFGCHSFYCRHNKFIINAYQFKRIEDIIKATNDITRATRGIGLALLRAFSKNYMLRKFM